MPPRRVPFGLTVLLLLHACTILVEAESPPPGRQLQAFTDSCAYTCGGVECCWRHYDGYYFSGPTDAQCADAAYSSHYVCTGLPSSQRHLPQIELFKNGASGGITLDECRTAAFNAAPIVDAMLFMTDSSRCWLQHSHGYSEVEAGAVEDASVRRTNIATRMSMGADFTLGSTNTNNHYGTHTNLDPTRGWFSVWNENWITAEASYEAWMVLSMSPPSPPPAAPNVWITNNAAFGGCAHVTFGNGDGDAKTQTCFTSSTIQNQFLYWHDRIEQHNVNNANPGSADFAYWPSIYNQLPGGMSPTAAPTAARGSTPSRRWPPTRRAPTRAASRARSPTRRTPSSA